MSDIPAPIKRGRGRPRKVALQAIPPEATYSKAGLAPGDKVQQRRNMAKHGYTCPSAHFIYGPADLTLAEIARAWDIPYSRLNLWARNASWEEQRDAHRLTVPATAGGSLVTPDLVDLKTKWVEKEMSQLETALEIAMKRLAEEEEEIMSPTGKKSTIKKRSSSFRSDVAALRDLHEGARVALGLHTKLTGQFAGANVDARSITAVQIMKPADAEPPALPAPVVSESIEGEVTEP